MEKARETLTALYEESFNNPKEFIRALKGWEEKKIHNVSPYFNYHEPCGYKEISLRSSFIRV